MEDEESELENHDDKQGMAHNKRSGTRISRQKKHEKMNESAFANKLWKEC